MRVFAVILAALLSSFATASDFLPETRYAADAPRFGDVLGYAAGERISSPANVRKWFDALEAAWPDRIKIFPYAKSWEGRELFYAVIGTPERISNLETIRADIQAIAHPNEHDADTIDAAMQRVPGTVWMAYSVHGNEISPADGAMFTAWHLLAAQDDAVVDSILEETLVFINPMQNPDGRARFVHNFEMAEGLEPAASRLAAEHDEPWPSGRVNHYLFDLNRDWLSITQPETKGHVAALLDWYPLAFVDAHEMGSDASFFFAPEAIPYNPLLADAQRDSLELFGKNNARWFDRFGFQYFTRDVFDAFYPGYGASWPSYYGGVAMTYEQGSARGLVMRLRDGTEMSYAETVREYVVASIATAQTVADNRAGMWRDFRDYRATSIKLGRSEGPRAWAIPTQLDQGGADRLAGLLASHGIDAFRTDEPLNACGRELEAGSYLIPADQPEYRKLRVLLDRNVEINADFIAEQERRRGKDLPDEIYDVTAWSLPLMFNIETIECKSAVAVAGMNPVNPGEIPAGEISNAEADVAWLVAGGSRATARLMAAALRRGLYVQSSEKAFVHAGIEYPSGSLIFPVAGNTELHGDRTADILGDLARETGVDVVGVDQSWISSGPDFGSSKVRRLIAPRVAIAWDAPTDVYSPGAIRYVLERQFGYPVVPIRTAHPDVDLLAFRAEHQVRESDEEAADDSDEKARVPGTLIESAEEFEQMAQPAEENPDSVAGVLVRAVVDPDHWLAAGVAESVNVLVRGDRIFTPMKRDQGRNAARFAAADELLASGHMWEENRRQLAFKPFVVTQNRGRGLVIGFTEDPAVRAYLDGLNMLLVNAVLRAPSYSSKLR